MKRLQQGVTGKPEGMSDAMFDWSVTTFHDVVSCGWLILPVVLSCHANKHLKVKHIWKATLNYTTQSIGINGLQSHVLFHLLCLQ